jgi:hypothetical protein
MQWSDIGPLVGGLAPTLGKMLGGAIGGPFGAMIGSTAGDILAKSLGVPSTPEAVHEAISDPGNQQRVVEAVQSAEVAAQAQWQALVAIAQAEADVAKTEAHETGETMRSELQLGALATGRMRDVIVLLQASWRPIAMFVWMGTWPWQLGFAFYQTTTEAARAAVLSNLTWWNTMPAVLAGAYSIGRSFEKIQDRGGVGGLAGKVVSLVTKRK